MRKSILAIGILGFTFLLTPVADAIPVYGTSAGGELIGNRSEPVEIITGGDWASDETDAVISWVVTDLGGGSWSYEYTFTNFFSPDISHVTLDLTDDCVGEDDQAADPGCVTQITGDLEFNTFGPGPSNPGFPAGESITGVKFDFGGESPFVIDFVSNRPPVYGDVYLQGGNESFAYNAGLANHASESILDFIVRPNSLRVPEPGTLLLLGSGFIGLGVMARRRRKA